MTSDLEFEGLLVSEDIQVLSRMTIAAVVTSGAVEELALEAGTDGVIYKPLTKISRAASEK